jgi:hypothetical protein
MASMEVSCWILAGLLCPIFPKYAPDKKPNLFTWVGIRLADDKSGLAPAVVMVTVEASSESIISVAPYVLNPHVYACIRVIIIIADKCCTTYCAAAFFVLSMVFYCVAHWLDWLPRVYSCRSFLIPQSSIRETPSESECLSTDRHGCRSV